MPQHHTAVAENSFKWLARKAGRMVRFMLAVPDDPDLKTYASRHPPSNSVINHGSRIGVLGPNIPSRAINKGKARATTPPHTCTPQDVVPAHDSRDRPKPTSQTGISTIIWSDSTKTNNNTAFTGATIASPLNGRYRTAPRGRGYQQGRFVTVLNPITSKILRSR